jgi:hypothetical protein
MLQTFEVGSAQTMRTSGSVLLALQLTLATCYGQVQVKVRDLSAHVSPVEVSGILSFNDDPAQRFRYSNQVEGYLRNKSGKDILLVVLHVCGSGTRAASLNLTYQKEYFFGLNVFKRGESEPFHSSLARFGVATVNGQPILDGENERGSRRPRATAETVFVQFADGTTWGNSESAGDAFIVRKQTLQELGRLEGILRDQGEQALREELSSSDLLLPCIGSLRSSCSGKADFCLADGLRSMIESAQQHQRTIQVESSALVDKLR